MTSPTNDDESIESGESSPDTPPETVEPGMTFQVSDKLLPINDVPREVPQPLDAYVNTNVPPQPVPPPPPPPAPPIRVNTNVPMDLLKKERPKRVNTNVPKRPKKIELPKRVNTNVPRKPTAMPPPPANTNTNVPVGLPPPPPPAIPMRPVYVNTNYQQTEFDTAPITGTNDITPPSVEKPTRKSTPGSSDTNDEFQLSSVPPEADELRVNPVEFEYVNTNVPHELIEDSVELEPPVTFATNTNVPSEALLDKIDTFVTNTNVPDELNKSDPFEDIEEFETNTNVPDELNKSDPFEDIEEFETNTNVPDDDHLY